MSSNNRHIPKRTEIGYTQSKRVFCRPILDFSDKNLNVIDMIDGNQNKRGFCKNGEFRG